MDVRRLSVFVTVKKNRYGSDTKNCRHKIRFFAKSSSNPSYSSSTVHNNGYSLAFARFIVFSDFVVAISYG